MSVLGEISTALKTDIADTYRAAVDPAFSRQLTQANFQDRRDKKLRTQALEDRAHNEQVALAKEDRANKAKMQMWAVTNAYNHWEGTNDAAPLIQVMKNVNPEIAKYGEALVGGAAPLKYLQRRDKVQNDIATLNLQQQRLLLDKQKKDTQEYQWQMEYYTKQTDSYLSNLVKQQKSFAEQQSGAQIVDFFANRRDPQMTPDQWKRYSALVRVPGQSKDQLQKVFDKYFQEQQTNLVESGKDNRATNSSNDVNTQKFLLKNYQQQSKAIRGTMQNIKEMESILSQSKNGTVNHAVTTKLMAVFSSNLRAMAEQQQWQNPGDIGERIAGAFSRWMTGSRTNTQFNEIKSLIKEYKKAEKQALNQFKADSYDRAKQLNVDPKFIFPSDQRYVIKEFDGKKYQVDLWRQKMRLMQ